MVYAGRSNAFRVQARIAAMKSRPHFDLSHLQLALVDYEMKDSYDEQAASREKVAISKIKRHPKSFYSYSKSFSSHQIQHSYAT